MALQIMRVFVRQKLGRLAHLSQSWPGSCVDEIYHIVSLLKLRESLQRMSKWQDCLYY